MELFKQGGIWEDRGNLKVTLGGGAYEKFVWKFALEIQLNTIIGGDSTIHLYERCCGGNIED